jgi:hypothetical protein
VAIVYLVVLYKVESSFHNEFRVNSQLLLLINFLVVTALVMYFLSARSKGKQGPTLNLNPSPEPGSGTVAGENPAEKVPEIKNAKGSATDEPDSPPVKISSAKIEVQEPVRKKEIVYFVYNGHEWEAHEVLGLESGVTLHEATQHYQNLIKTSDPSTFEFYDAAFAAILKLKRNNW